MQPLPRDFLTQLARHYDLSSEQQEAFVELFNSNQAQLKCAEVLHISPSAFRTRMTGVYNKFSIRSKGPNKARMLHDVLIKEYQKSLSSVIPDIPDAPTDINALVQQARETARADIQDRCGTMRVLDMTQPIGLNDIYTHVNILESITGRRRKGIADLLQDCNAEEFERFALGKITEPRVPGLDAVAKYSKLMIWGKPGAGKTTFLKYLAIQCIQGKFLPDKLPIFVTLKDFAEAANQPALLEYIGEFNNFDSLQDILKQGNALMLLDGLDEVREEDSHRVLKEIRYFSHQFRDNHFVMACRIAAREYTFEKFIEVEIADFDERQISNFANNWFKGKAVKAETFLNRIEDNDRIEELATNPLLLTLLCLTFEETADFPTNRSELYKEGLDVLLKKWDVKQGIERDTVYKKLSCQRKEDLLSTIAFTTFEHGDYFFKKRIAEHYITDYIRNLPGASTDEEALQLDSEAVLRSIEAQHGLLVERAKGIYSFSHLTFHEYFTAREIITAQQSSDESLQILVSHITDRRWREVFLLAVEMSPNANKLLLLMKKHTDTILDDEGLQNFLNWVNQKSNNGFLYYPLDAVKNRVCYLCLEYQYQFRIFELSEVIELADLILGDIYFYIMDLPKYYNLSLDKNCQELLLYRYYVRYSPNDALHSELDEFCDYPLPSEMKKEIRELQKNLPDINQTEEEFEKSWNSIRDSWTTRLKKVMIKYRDIGHDWKFDRRQVNALKEYYDANLLLVECLNSDCYVSREVRQEIEETLLLPIAEIEKRKSR